MRLKKMLVGRCCTREVNLRIPGFENEIGRHEMSKRVQSVGINVTTSIEKKIYASSITLQENINLRMWCTEQQPSFRPVYHPTSGTLRLEVNKLSFSGFHI